MATEIIAQPDDSDEEVDTRPRETHARPDCLGFIGVDATGRYCITCGARITSMHQIRQPKMRPVVPPYGSLYTTTFRRMAAFLSVLACVSAAACTNPTSPTLSTAGCAQGPGGAGSVTRIELTNKPCPDSPVQHR